MLLGGIPEMDFQLWETYMCMPRTKLHQQQPFGWDGGKENNSLSLNPVTENAILVEQ